MMVQCHWYASCYHACSLHQGCLSYLLRCYTTSLVMHCHSESTCCFSCVPDTSEAKAGSLFMHSCSQSISCFSFCAFDTPVSKVGTTGAQRHLLGCANSICALACSGPVIVSAEAGKLGLIRLWDAPSGQCQALLQGMMLTKCITVTAIAENAKPCWEVSAFAAL